MPEEDVLSDAKERFQIQVNRAYRSARRELNNQLVGEAVKLVYPFQEGESEGDRVGKVYGTVEKIQVGKLPYQNVDFAVFVTFQDGREFIDAERIIIQ